MGHDVTKVLMGQTLSSAKDMSVYEEDPASFEAGLALVLKDGGGLSKAYADANAAGFRIGISAGKSLSNHKKLSVVRTGERVPIRAALKRARGTVTITSYANLVSGTDDAITIAGQAFTFQSASVTPGDATAQAATGNSETAASLAAQINAHAVVSLKVKAAVSGAVVTLWSVAEGIGSTGTGNDIAVSYTDNDTNVGLTLAGLSGGKLANGSDTISAIDYGTKGAKVYINDTTGKADVAAFGHISDAIYVVSPLTGIDEAGNSVGAALVDMPGGL